MTITATVTPAPPPPDHETDDDFQRRIDALIGRERPAWVEPMFWVAFLGLLAFSIAAVVYAILTAG